MQQNHRYLCPHVLWTWTCVSPEDPQLGGKLTSLGGTCPREVAEVTTWARWFQSMATLDQPPSTATSLIISHFLSIKRPQSLGLL